MKILTNCKNCGGTLVDLKCPFCDTDYSDYKQEKQSAIKCAICKRTFIGHKPEDVADLICPDCVTTYNLMKNTNEILKKLT